MHRRERPSRGEHENPVRGVARDVVILGGDARVTLDIHGVDTPLTFEVSAHVAARNRVAAGAEVSVFVARGRHPSGAGVRVTPSAKPACNAATAADFVSVFASMSTNLSFSVPEPIPPAPQTETRSFTPTYTYGYRPVRDDTASPSRRSSKNEPSPRL